MRGDTQRLDDVLAAAAASEPAIPWHDVAGMRDHLAYRYFDADHAIVAATVDHDLPPLIAAVKRLKNRAHTPDRGEPRQRWVGGSCAGASVRATGSPSRVDQA